MSSTGELYDRLAAAASLEGDDAAIRISAVYEPSGGHADKVSPPTYPLEDGSSPYLVEKRWGSDGQEIEVVLLDSRQAQANRCEEAIQAEIDAGRVTIPHLVLSSEPHGVPLRITSLEAPHRSRDAYFRDAQDGAGLPFDSTEAGKALKGVRPEDATPLYRYSPADLVYGVWDSHRSLRLATRFPRVYTSEVTGWEVLSGVRAAGRFDLVVSGGRKVQGGNEDWEAGDGSRGVKVSKLGHGSIPPSLSMTKEKKVVGGVSVQHIARHGSIGFAGLARTGFASLDPAAARAARAVLAAIAVFGDRAAYAQPAVFLRSGCELVLLEDSLTWVGRGGEHSALDVNLEEARELLRHAVGVAEAAGLTWQSQPTELKPQEKLKTLIEEAFYKSPVDDEG